MADLAADPAAGPWPEPVTVVAVEPLGPDASTVILRRTDGTISEEMFFAGDPTVSRSFRRRRNLDVHRRPREFKLATGLCASGWPGYDPMLAVGTSDISPLPHQIRAVYGELPPHAAALPARRRPRRR